MLGTGNARSTIASLARMESNPVENNLRKNLPRGVGFGKLSVFLGLLAQAEAEYVLSGSWGLPDFSTRANMNRVTFTLLKTSRSLNRWGHALVKPFRRGSKSGETPDTRAAWMLQTRLKSAPESVTRCNAWLKVGTQETDDSKTTCNCDVLARKGFRWNLRNSSFSTDSDMQYFTPIYSQRRTEAEVQADLYCAIKTFALDARLEAHGYLLNDAVRKKCRFDIVVFWPLNHRLICIVECKKGLGMTRNSKQLERYRKFGCPVFVCGRNGQFEVLNEVLELAHSQKHLAPPSFDWDKFYHREKTA